MMRNWFVAALAAVLLAVPAAAAGAPTTLASGCNLNAGYPYRVNDWAEGHSYASCSGGESLHIQLTLQMWFRTGQYWGTVSSTGWQLDDQFTRVQCRDGYGHSWDGRWYRLITSFQVYQGGTDVGWGSQTHKDVLECVR